MAMAYSIALCSSGASLCSRGLLAAIGEPAAEGSLPEWIPLIPAGEKIDALDGRKFTNPEPQAVIDAFNADPRDLPVDWEHATETLAPEGHQAPAAGWIDRMEVRDGGAIWGHVKEWTPRGAESLKNKEYKYISPAFLFKKASKAIIEIVSAALVNRPALNMPALARRIADREKPTAAARGKSTELNMDPETLQILAAELGLEDGATEEAVLSSIRELRADPTDKLAEVVKERDELQAKLKNAETELANARSASPSLDSYVPRADYDQAVASANELRAEKDAELKRAHDEAVEAALDEASKAGKITPESRDFYKANCATKEGLEKFREFAKAQPAICDPSDLDTDPPPVRNDGTVTADSLSIAARCGVTQEAYKAAL